MSQKNDICRVCGEPTLVPHKFSITINYGSHELEIEGLSGLLCSSCNAEVVPTAQVRENDRLIMEAKRKSKGMLTGDEILAGRKHLGLSQSRAACLFGGGANAFSKYERGEVMQSESMDKLLRLVISDPRLLSRLQGNLDCGFLSLSSPQYSESKRRRQSNVIEYSAKVGVLNLQPNASNQGQKTDDTVAA